MSFSSRYMTSFGEYPLFSCRPWKDSPPTKLNLAMSTLLRPSHLVSYLPLPQNSHIDDDNDGGKERIQALHRQGKRRLWSPCLQLAMILVLLLLAGTAGFFIALSLPRNRLASSSLPDTVPQGEFSFPPVAYATR